MLKANAKIVNATIQFEADTPANLVKEIGMFGDVPNKCGNCGHEDLVFFSKTPQGNLYIGVKCPECGFTCTFGQNKEGGGFFIKDNGKFEPPYQGNSDGGGGNSQQQSSAPEIDDDDDIPF